MFKWLRYIGAALLLPVFLVSATGFRIVKHSCTQCNVVEYAIGDAHSCCDHQKTPVSAKPLPASCCQQDQQENTPCEGECCSFVTEYFVTDETISTPSSKAPALLHQAGEAVVGSILHNVPIEDSAVHLAGHTTHHMPGGKILLLLIHQLRLDCTFA